MLHASSLSGHLGVLQAKKNLPEDVYLTNQIRERQHMEVLIAQNQALA